MSYSDKTDIRSDSGSEEYVDRCYEQLRDDSRRVKISEELFMCPYCLGRKKRVYSLKDLLQHAIDLGNDCSNKDIERKGKHLGLVKYLKNYYNQKDLALDLAGVKVHPSPRDYVNELFVWPWVGVLANVGDRSISKLKNNLAKRGFDPVRVNPLFGRRYALVEFKSDWPGFYNAVMFEKEFEVDHHGKKDYLAASRSDGIYGWVARDDDYNAKGVLGEYLQDIGHLRTISDVETDVKCRTDFFASEASHLRRVIQGLEWQLREIEDNSYSKSQSGSFPVAAKKGPTFVAWDVFTCPLPLNEKDCNNMFTGIRSANFLHSPSSRICTIKGYGAINLPLSIRRILYIGMSLLYSSPESHVRKMIAGMNRWAKAVPAPANFMVISCEKGLSSTLEDLHSRGYNILVVHPDENPQADLIATASCVWKHSSLLSGDKPYIVCKDLVPSSFGLAACGTDGKYGTVARGVMETQA